jgi:predicted transcriptional regulator of viral defense system
VQRGQLQKLGRGIYSAPTAPSSEHISLLEVSRKIPKGVICLLSALRFHEIGTQLPAEVWIAIDVKAWRPRVNSPAIRIVRFSGRALYFGVQEPQVVGGKIRVFSPAKTVADCFKYRHKIGMDVALEALREAYMQRKASMNDLFEAATRIFVHRVLPKCESRLRRDDTRSARVKRAGWEEPLRCRKERTRERCIICQHQSLTAT